MYAFTTVTSRVCIHNCNKFRWLSVVGCCGCSVQAAVGRVMLRGFTLQSKVSTSRVCHSRLLLCREQSGVHVAFGLAARTLCALGIPFTTPAAQRSACGACGPHLQICVLRLCVQIHRRRPQARQRHCLLPRAHVAPAMGAAPDQPKQRIRHLILQPNTAAPTHTRSCIALSHSKFKASV